MMMKYYPMGRKNDYGMSLFDSDFDDFFAPMFGTKHEVMKTDVREKDGKYLLDVELPGFDKKDVALSLENGYLTVRAEKNETEEQKEHGKFIRRERRCGSCSRSFYVGDVSEKDVSARFENGMLTVSFPKERKETETRKQISID